MSRTNLDFLFQVTAPIGERSTFGLPRADEPAPGFVNHLSQASSTTLGPPTATSRSGDRPPARESSSSGYDSSSPDSARDAAATTAEGSVRPEDDPDRDEDEATDPTQLAALGGSAAVSQRPDDGNGNTGESDAVGDEPAVAASALVSKHAANVEAYAESSTTDSPGDATQESIAVDASANADSSDADAAAKREAATLANANATADDAILAKPDAIAAATTPAESVDETAVSNANKKVRATKSKAVSETEQQAHRGEQTGGQPADAEQGSNIGIAIEIETAELESTDANPTAIESEQSARDNTADENRDPGARTSARQRSDATELATKAAAAPVVSSAAARLDNGRAAPEAADRTATVGKAGGARVDAVGEGANRLHANAGLVKRGDGADDMPRVDPARFVGRVAKAFHTAQERGGTLQIRLSPPELGAMRLELTVKEGVMTAALETESVSARRILLEHLPALRDRLAEQNIRIERFDVDVRRDGTGGQADPRASQDQQHGSQGHSERRQPAAPQRQSTPARMAAALPQVPTNSSGINLVA